MLVVQKPLPSNRPLAELANIVTPFPPPFLTWNTGRNCPWITGISAPAWSLHCHLHQRQKPFLRQPPPTPPPSSTQQNGQSDDCCVSVGGTDTREPVFAPPLGRIVLQLWAPSVCHCNICILPSIGALSSGLRQRATAYSLQPTEEL